MTKTEFPLAGTSNTNPPTRLHENIQSQPGQSKRETSQGVEEKLQSSEGQRTVRRYKQNPTISQNLTSGFQMARRRGFRTVRRIEVGFNTCFDGTRNQQLKTHHQHHHNPHPHLHGCSESCGIALSWPLTHLPEAFHDGHRQQRQAQHDQQPRHHLLALVISVGNRNHRNQRHEPERDKTHKRPDFDCDTICRARSTRGKKKVLWQSTGGGPNAHLQPPDSYRNYFFYSELLHSSKKAKYRNTFRLAPTQPVYCGSPFSWRTPKRTAKRADTPVLVLNTLVVMTM